MEFDLIFGYYFSLNINDFTTTKCQAYDLFVWLWNANLSLLWFIVCF